MGGSPFDQLGGRGLHGRKIAGQPFSSAVKPGGQPLPGPGPSLGKGDLSDSVFDPATGLWTRRGSGKSPTPNYTIGAAPVGSASEREGGAADASMRQRRRAKHNALLIEGQPGDGVGINPMAILQRRMLGGYA